MKNSTTIILRFAACLSALMVASGCDSSDTKANAALGEYQSAAASNDLPGARRALLKLVLAKDDVPEYWLNLGKVEASMGSYGEAYYALTRAYELDRSNPDLLRALTEMGLRAGDLNGARQHSNELAVVAPNDPWIRLARGWADIAELRYEEALTESEGMIAADPTNPAAQLLKGRALVGLNRSDEAIQLLTKEVQAQPLDGGSLALLVKIYEGRGDWANATEFAGRLARVAPGLSNGLSLVELSFRTGNSALARQASLQLLRPDAPPGQIAEVLELWADLWPSAQRIEDAKRLAQAAAGPDQKLVYAAFLSRVGSPTDAQRIATPYASLPVNAASAEANAVLGDALLRSGNISGAKSRLDAVIVFDPGNATGLRARTEAWLKMNNSKAAIQDAQKLVTVLPHSARDRLVLARAFAAGGDQAAAERALWVALQAIPGNPTIFSALAATRNGNPDALRALRSEYHRQQEAKLGQGLL